MKRFDPDTYYYAYKDGKILDDKNNLVVDPQEEGRELIAQYYSQKYGTNITFPVGKDEKYLYVDDFIANFAEHIAVTRTQAGDRDNYRQAFFLGQIGSHAIPIIYLREQGKEGILFADSQFAEKTEQEKAKLIENLSDFTKKTGIDVYIVEETRQSDLYSCYSDTAVFGRDTTAINPQTNDYYTPKLLSSLQERAIEKEGYYATKLPNQLLKTAQISQFVATHRQEEPHDAKIHKDENLDEFRKRYTAHNTPIKKRIDKNEFVIQHKDLSTYVRTKGIKHADVIEIQFYLNEVHKESGESMTPAARKEFIQHAKEILKQQGHSGPEALESRDGLYAFAKQFLDNTLKNKN